MWGNSDNDSAGVEEVAAWGCDGELYVDDSERLFRFVAHCVLLNAVGAAGLLGNTLSALILVRPQMYSSVNCLLVSLAVSNSVHILMTVLLFGLTALFPYTGHLRHYYYRVAPLLAPYAFTIASATRSMSLYITLFATLERWISVSHPRRARTLCTATCGCGLVLATVAFALAYNAPRFYEVVVKARNDSGVIYYCIIANIAFQTDSYVSVYKHWSNAIVMYVVPFPTLILLGMSLQVRLRRAREQSARLTRVLCRELDLASMVVLVIIVLITCNVVPLVIDFFNIFLGDWLQNFNPLVMTGNLLITVNSSANFIIYLIFSENFKQTLVESMREVVFRRRLPLVSPERIFGGVLL